MSTLKTPELAGEIAQMVTKLAGYQARDINAVMDMAEDELNENGSAKAGMMLEGMRSGIDQARAAHAGSRVLVIWHDDWGARSIFAWPGGEGASDNTRRVVTRAMQPDGEHEEGDT